jgi:Fur family ferric uptake transcriptional regulator
MPRPSQPGDKDHDHAALLRAAGLRVTPVRLGVLRCLCQTHEVVTADQIVEELSRTRAAKGRARKPDRVTVYRTLNALVEAGIAHKMDPGDRVFRFGLTGDHAAHVPSLEKSCGCGESENCGHPATAVGAPRISEQGHGHPHFLCESCGKVECMEDTEVVLQPRAGSPRRSVRQQEVLLKGTCGECDPAGKPAA